MPRRKATYRDTRPPYLPRGVRHAGRPVAVGAAQPTESGLAAGAARPTAPGVGPWARVPASTRSAGRTRGRRSARRELHRVGPHDDGVGHGDDLVDRQLGAGGVVADRLGTARLVDANGAHTAVLLVQYIAADPADVVGHLLA